MFGKEEEVHVGVGVGKASCDKNDVVSLRLGIL